MMKKDFLKLLVCYHKPDILVKDDVFTPIHVGRECAIKTHPENDENLKWMLEYTIGDDTGENISGKNSSYNELTAIYWAWKNYDKLGNPKYIGLCHYRRYFVFRESNEVVENIREIDDNFFDYINYNQKTIEHLFDDCDYVSHIGKVDGIYKHYKENHHIEDLELAIEILKRKFPDYASVADDYMDMSYGNFFNMFILPKHLFFKYCEWIFDILGEFESQVDTSEKRLFISERLTGIFIEKLKRDKYKQKSLPVVFVDAPSRTPVVLPFCKEVFKTAVTIESILLRARVDTHVDFYILHSEKDKIDTHALDSLFSQYSGHTITYVNVVEKLKQKGISSKQFKFPEHYPLVVAEVLDKVNKALYINERTIFFGDIANVFRECNNDEFRIIGLKHGDEEDAISGDVFCLHLGRLRKHSLINDFGKNCKGNTASATFEKVCKKHIGVFPWWNYSWIKYQENSKMCYDRCRGDERWDKAVWSRAVLYYDKGLEPWTYIQGLYSVYWWEYAAKISAGIPYDAFDKNSIKMFYDNSVEVCLAAEVGKKSLYRNKNEMDARKKARSFANLKKYLRTHGLKTTIKRGLKNIFGSEK